MQTILITGGAGYIGSHAVKLFLQNGYKVIVVDNLSRGYQQAIDVLKNYGDLVFEIADLTDLIINGFKNFIQISQKTS